MVMEYIQSDLNVLLKNKIDFNERQLLKIIYNALLGISFVHFTNTVHRDIKPGNLLLTASCDIKVCDFGLARTIAQAFDPTKQPLNSLKLGKAFDQRRNSRCSHQRQRAKAYTEKKSVSPCWVTMV